MKLNKKSILKTITIVISIFVLLIIGLFLFTSPPTHIKYEKGLLTHDIEINDTIGHHQLKGKVWSLPNSKPKGIILISHGFSSHVNSMAIYASKLAHKGYLVAGVTHDDIPLLKTREIINDPMIARQRHLTLLLKQIYKNSDNPNIDNLPVGLLGYSLGSFSVLNVSGVNANFANQNNYCQTDLGKQNIIMCNPKFTERMQSIQSAKNIENNQLQVNAIAVLAPAYTVLFDDNFSDMPTFMIYGELDEYINPNEIENFAQSNKIISKKKLLKNAGHYVYLPSCSFLQFGEHCNDPKKLNRIEIQENIANELVAFFDENMQ